MTFALIIGTIRRELNAFIDTLKGRDNTPREVFFPSSSYNRSQKRPKEYRVSQRAYFINFLNLLGFAWKREGERRDLNPRPLEPQSSALPAELRPPRMRK